MIKLVDSLKFSWSGFQFAWKNEATFRQKLISVLNIVELAEITNSAIEAVGAIC